MFRDTTILLPKTPANLNAYANKLYFELIPLLEKQGINVNALRVNPCIDQAAIRIVENQAIYVSSLPQTEEISASHYFYQQPVDRDDLRNISVVFNKQTNPIDRYLQQEKPRVVIDNDNGMGILVVNGNIVTYTDKPMESRKIQGFVIS